MKKELLIEKTIAVLHSLSAEKVMEVSDFAHFLLKKNEERILAKDMAALSSESLNFLNEDAGEYKLSDLKVKYND